jgi:hypothetical protein
MFIIFICKLLHESNYIRCIPKKTKKERRWRSPVNGLLSCIIVKYFCVINYLLNEDQGLLLQD